MAFSYWAPVRLCAATIVFAAAAAAAGPAAVIIDYPANGSVFPPDFPAPTFLWREPRSAAVTRTIDITFANGAEPIHVKVRGGRMRVGEIDQRAVGPTNHLPSLTAEQTAALTWTPDAPTWASIRKNSTDHPASVTISAYTDAAATAAPVARGKVAIRTSTDPVGAPIFYRDVPLMPSETEKGVIKPLASSRCR